jgi:hypothetical protein
LNHKSQVKEEKMSEFYFTQLEENEKMVFGPVTSRKSSSASFSAGGQRVGGATHITESKVGVTNRRIIAEQAGAPSATRIIPNDEVKAVFIRREKFAGRPHLAIANVQTSSGQTVKLNLGGLSAQAEGAIQQTFPNATIQEKKGCLGFLK